MKEAYCSYEVAKLLKEKGFNEACHKTYDTVTHDIGNFIHCGNYGLISNIISAPTHQMAVAWLRETYNIHIEIKRDNQYYRGEEVIPMTKYDKERGHKPDYYGVVYDEKSNITTTEHFNKYEDAIEAALKYVLKNLLVLKN